MSRGTREVARLIRAMGGNELSAYGLCHLGTMRPRCSRPQPQPAVRRVLHPPSGLPPAGGGLLHRGGADGAQREVSGGAAYMQSRPRHPVRKRRSPGAADRAAAAGTAGGVRRLIPSIDKGRHGFDGQKCAHTASSPLDNTVSILCGSFLVWTHFCSGKTAPHLPAMYFRVIFGFETQAG